MLTAKEARAYGLRRASPEDRRAFLKAERALKRKGLIELSDTPAIIVGGEWPTDVPGAMRAVCADCKMYVCLSPNSGRPMAEQFPDVPIVCWPCCEKRAAG